jgi:hypothetical protein
MKKVKTKTIEKERWYKLTEIVAFGFFPWCKDIKTVRNWVHRDKLTDNKLKAVITGTGKQARYNILGKNIIEFVAHFEKGGAKN